MGDNVDFAYSINCDLKRGTKNSCGYDFIVNTTMVFEPGNTYDIDTNVCILNRSVNDLPSWGKWFMMVAPRSSLGMKYGMRFANTVGIIDQDYNGTIRAKFTVDKTMVLHKGDKLMQGIIVPYLTFADEEKPITVRDGGIGSTDKKENKVGPVYGTLFSDI